MFWLEKRAEWEPLCFFFVNRCLQNPTNKPVSCSIASMHRLWLHSGIAQNWSAKGPQICFSFVATIPRIYKYCCWTRKTLKVHPSGTSTVAAQQGIAPTYHISSGQQSGKRSMGSFNLSHSWSNRSNPQVKERRHVWGQKFAHTNCFRIFLVQAMWEAPSFIHFTEEAQACYDLLWCIL